MTSDTYIGERVKDHLLQLEQLSDVIGAIHYLGNSQVVGVKAITGQEIIPWEGVSELLFKAESKELQYDQGFKLIFPPTIVQPGAQYFNLNYVSFCHMDDLLNLVYVGLNSMQINLVDHELNSCNLIWVVCDPKHIFSALAIFVGSIVNSGQHISA